MERQRVRVKNITAALYKTVTAITTPVVLTSRPCLSFGRKVKHKQDRQCTYNVTLRRVHEPIVAVNSNKYYILVCVCMLTQACVRACGYTNAWACACAYVHIALLIQHATRRRHIVTSFVAPPSPKHSSHYLINGAIFGKKSYWIWNVCFHVLYNSSKTFLIQRRI
jgi:hypothetical protein